MESLSVRRDEGMAEEQLCGVFFLGYLAWSDEVYMICWVAMVKNEASSRNEIVFKVVKRGWKSLHHSRFVVGLDVIEWHESSKLFC